MRKTIKEIAKEAGVSKTVISAVVNKKFERIPFLSEKKKRLILHLIKKYDYVPRKSARDLSYQKTNIIGIILHRLTPFFSQLVEELQKYAFSHKIEVMPYITEGIPEREEEYLNMMRDGRVDGVIVAGTVKGSKKRYLKYTNSPYNMKLVTIAIPPIDNIPSVCMDEEKVGIISAKHLIDIGCKRLCVFGGEKNFIRCESFIKYAKERNIEVKFLTEKHFVAYYHQGRKLAKKLLKEKEIPDGIFAFNDSLGVALMVEVLKEGIKVPQELAIISCDNTQLCECTFPEITSIDNNTKLLAKIAFEKIIAKINNKEIKEIHTKTEPKLIIRGSTKKEAK